MLLSIASFLAITTTIISFVPQAIKVYRTKSCGDICIISMGNGALCALSWIVYGALIKDFTVWSPNVLMLLSSLYIIYFKLSYKRKTI